MQSARTITPKIKQRLINIAITRFANPPSLLPSDARPPPPPPPPLFEAGVFSDRLGSLADGEVSQLPGKQQEYRRLDLLAGDSRSAAVANEARGLPGDALERVVDEAVHHAHRHP